VGRVEAAAAAYRRAKELAPDSEIAAEAERRLRRLGAGG